MSTSLNLNSGSPEVETCDESTCSTIWSQWTDLWNGQPSSPDSFLSDEMTVHLPAVGMPPGESLRTREHVVDWIHRFRSGYRDDARFTTELGPWTVDGHIVSRWRFDGTWVGGVPSSAAAPSGTRVNIHGVDILRIRDGRIAEYWLCDDQLDLYSQLHASVPDWTGSL